MLHKKYMIEIDIDKISSFILSKKFKISLTQL